MAKTRFFRTAVEGATATDGRTITREMIDQSAEAYNTVTYTARINCEHLRGFALETPVAQPDASAGALGAMKAFFEKFTASPTPPAPVAPVVPTPPVQPVTPANDNNFAQIVEGLGLIGASLSALSAKVDSDVGAIRGEFGTLKTRLETTEAPNGFSRQPHGGGNVDAKFATDC